MAQTVGEPPSDGGIFMTLIIGLIVFLILFPIWVCVRRYFPYVYFKRETDNPQQYSLWRWAIPVIVMSEGDFMDRAGLSGPLFINTKITSMIYIGIICIVSLPILLPVYAVEAQDDKSWFAATIASALEPNSEATWLTLIWTLVVTALFVFLYLVFFLQYLRLLEKRKAQGGLFQRTIKVKGIPGKITDEELLKQSVEAASGKPVVEFNIGWDCSKGTQFYNKLQSLEDSLEDLEEESGGDSKQIRPPVWKLPGIVACKKKVNAKQYYQEEIQKNRENLQEQYDKLQEKPKHSGVGFCIFETVDDRDVTLYNWKGAKDECKSKNWTLVEPGVPEDLLWNNFSANRIVRFIKQAIFLLFFIILAFIWAIPIAFLSSLSNLAGLPGIGPPIDTLINISPFLTALIEQFLPAILTLIFFALLAPVSLFVSKLEKHHSMASTQSSAMTKYFAFIFLNSFVLLMLFMGGANAVQEVYDGDLSVNEAFQNLNWGIYAAFYCNWFIAMALIGMILKLWAFHHLIIKNIKHFLARKKSEKKRDLATKPSEFKYFVEFAKQALFLSIASCFAPIAPLVPASALIYFGISTFVDKSIIQARSAYDPRLQKFLYLKYLIVIIISFSFTCICWAFFFFTHGPRYLGVIGSIIYIGVLILMGVSVSLSSFFTHYQNKKLAGTRGYPPGEESVELFRHPIKRSVPGKAAV